MLQHSMFPISDIWKPFGKFLSLFSQEHQSDYQAVWGNLTHEYAILNNHDKEKLLITLKSLEFIILHLSCIYKLVKLLGIQY